MELDPCRGTARPALSAPAEQSGDGALAPQPTRTMEADFTKPRGSKRQRVHCRRTPEAAPTLDRLQLETGMPVHSACWMLPCADKAFSGPLRRPNPELLGDCALAGLEVV